MVYFGLEAPGIYWRREGRLKEIASLNAIYIVNLAFRKLQY
jgi:hypothetical protein